MLNQLLARFRLGPCAVVGAAAGMFAGVIYALVQDEHPGESLTAGELLLIAALSAAFAYLLCLLVIGVWYRYGVRSMALPALVTALLSAVLAVWVSDAIGVPEIAPIVGFVLGFVLGALLCEVCKLLPAATSVEAGREHE